MGIELEALRRRLSRLPKSRAERGTSELLRIPGKKLEARVGIELEALRRRLSRLPKSRAERGTSELLRIPGKNLEARVGIECKGIRSFRDLQGMESSLEEHHGALIVPLKVPSFLFDQ